MTTGKGQPISLFQAENGYGNAVLNFRSVPEEEFDHYARAFHRAGRALSQQLIAASGYNDVDACPIVFVYRHALELYLKSIVMIGEGILRLLRRGIQGATPSLKGHRLSTFIPFIQDVFTAVGWEWRLDIDGLRSFAEIEAIVKDIDAADAGSYTFRYPVDTKGIASVPAHFVVNVPAFSSIMDEVLDTLDAAVMGLSVLRDQLKQQVVETTVYDA